MLQGFGNLNLEQIPFKKNDIVFLSGSRAEGWANQSSDYDFYVVGNDHQDVRSDGGLLLPGVGKRVKRVFIVSSGHRVEVQYWNLQDIIELADNVRKYEANPLVFLWHEGLELLHRLRIGIPLHNKERFSKLIESIDFGHLEVYLTRYYLRVYESYYNDAIAAIRSNTLVDALLMAKLSLDNIIDAYLALAHQTNPQPKWRYRKLLKNESQRLTRDYLSAIAIHSVNSKRMLLEDIKKHLLLAETINICLQLGLRYDDLLIPDHKYELPLRFIQRRLEAKIKTEKEKISIVLPDGTGFQINEIAALIWALLDGRHPKETLCKYIASKYRRKLNEVAIDFDIFLKALRMHHLIEMRKR